MRIPHKKRALCVAQTELLLLVMQKYLQTFFTFQRQHHTLQPTRFPGIFAFDNMTRFTMALDESVGFVVNCINMMPINCNYRSGCLEGRKTCH